MIPVLKVPGDELGGEQWWAGSPQRVPQCSPTVAKFKTKTLSQI